MSDLESLSAVPLSKLSAQLFTIPLPEDRYLVYAPLRRAAFIANASLVNLLADFQDGAIPAQPHEDVLAFLRELHILDSEPETQPTTSFAGEPKPTQLTLFMTTACNLRCTYCYASAGDTPLRSMSIESACRGVDFVVANAVETDHRSFKVVYHGGGEPTVNWKVLTESYNYATSKANELDLTFTASAGTNGVLSDEQIDWIIEHLTGGVSLSFDGLPEIHDRHRLTISGQGSSDRVLHTLRRFDEAGYPYGVRLTVTHETVARLPEAMEFLCSQFHPRRMQVEPAYQLGRWEGAPTAETEAFIEAYRAARTVAQEYGRNLSYSAARLDVLTNHFCGVTQDIFALSPNGNVSGCYEVFSEDSRFADLFFYGKSDLASGKFQFNLPVLDALRQQTVDNRAFCNGCFARWHCAGDCLHKSLNVNGRVPFAGSQRCHITRELTKDLILERILESGGLVWHDIGNDDSADPLSAGKELFL